MKTLRLVKVVVIAALCWFPLTGLSAQEVNCVEVAAMARMARAKSSAVLTAEKIQAGDSYRAQLVFAARLLQLRPTQRHAADLLLNLIPKDDGQQTTWMTLGDAMCGAERVSDMKSLGRLGESLPRDLAKAVLIVPDRMLDYVSYAYSSIQDPHSDYAVQMQTVCRVKHAEFVKAVEGLPIDQKDWFVKHVFNPDVCHALALPEAE